jgi:uncharacterized membrane protein
VITEELPSIFESFGGTPSVFVDPDIPQSEVAFYYVTNGQVEVLLVDASKAAGNPYYQHTTVSFDIPRARQGVPRLIVGDRVLVGALEIPEQFSAIIRDALAAEGLDWPTIEGLADEIARIPVTLSAAAASDSATEPEQQSDTASRPPETTLDEIPVQRETMLDKFSRDPVGNSLSVVVLIGMMVSVIVVAGCSPGRKAGKLSAAVPVWAAAGIAVAGYLTYVEASGTAAVCGPIGDCNAVQQSPYATLLGVVPVGMAGLVGYVAIVVAWVAARQGGSALARRATVALFGMTFVGTILSIYLTFLEAFVIGATCAWCLSSAVIMTVLLWLTAGPGTAAWDALTTAKSPSGPASP